MRFRKGPSSVVQEAGRLEDRVPNGLEVQSLFSTESKIFAVCRLIPSCQLPQQNRCVTSSFHATNSHGLLYGCTKSGANCQT